MVVLVGGVVLVVVLLAVVVDGVVVDEVVVVVEGAGVGDGDGDGVKMFLTVVPAPVFPKIAASGFPEISSMAVMNISAITNTMAAVPAMVVQRNFRGLPARPDGPAGCIGRVVASMRCVAGAPATAEISRRSVPSAGAADDAISIVSALASGAVAPVGPRRSANPRRSRPACAGAGTTPGPARPPA